TELTGGCVSSIVGDYNYCGLNSPQSVTFKIANNFFFDHLETSADCDAGFHVSASTQPYNVNSNTLDVEVTYSGSAPAFDLSCGVRVFVGGPKNMTWKV
ncbi:MAG: hypothetical protein M3M96_00765, partial [Candidatus Eremiobacteraeota bacterium]|nr:hypothetical protein [Candidatus Eremiobacteraeota bacterium]